MNQLNDRINTFMKYRHLLQALVERDVKLKYRRSFLGYLWSILNPLKQTALADFWSQPLENCAVEVLDLSGSRLSMSEM